MREIPLPRSLDITVVRSVADAIRHALVTGELTLDATAVAKVDAAGLQLLCAAVAAARVRAARVTWRGVTPALAEGARTLALSEALGLASTALQEK